MPQFKVLVSTSQDYEIRIEAKDNQEAEDKVDNMIAEGDDLEEAGAICKGGSADIALCEEIYEPPFNR